MARTIPPASMAPCYPERYGHRGGHLPFPPEDCGCLEHSFEADGIRWLDACFCAHNLCGRAPCPRRRRYSAKECVGEVERLLRMGAGNFQTGKETE